MEKDFFQFLGELLNSIDTIKFLIYVFSIALFISLPTLLSLIKESAIIKKIKNFNKSNSSQIEKSSLDIINYIEESNLQISIILDKLNDKLNLLADKRTNILDIDSVFLFITPVFKNISLGIYKNIDLLMYEYNLEENKKDIKIIIKRDISVRFKKAYKILSKYRLISGHKISFFINEKWEHWLYKDVEKLLFNSDISKSSIRIHLWNLLETSIDQYIDDIQRKISS